MGQFAIMALVLSLSLKKKKDILANANNVAEQAAAVKALKAGDKAAASIMAV